MEQHSIFIFKNRKTDSEESAIRGIINYTTKNYTGLGQTYQLVLPLSLEGLIPEDDSVRLLSHELEDLDYTKLYQAYSAKGRNPAVDPKTMFKIVTYAYSQNIYSSRKIEKACKRDLNFLWLLAGAKAPDHTTIARFRSFYLSDACEDLFYQLILRLADRGEIPFEHLFIDGTNWRPVQTSILLCGKKLYSDTRHVCMKRFRTALEP